MNAGFKKNAKNKKQLLGRSNYIESKANLNSGTTVCRHRIDSRKNCMPPAGMNEVQMKI